MVMRNTKRKGKMPLTKHDENMPDAIEMKNIADVIPACKPKQSGTQPLLHDLLRELLRLYVQAPKEYTQAEKLARFNAAQNTVLYAAMRRTKEETTLLTHVCKKMAAISQGLKFSISENDWSPSIIKQHKIFPLLIFIEQNYDRCQTLVNEKKTLTRAEKAIMFSETWHRVLFSEKSKRPPHQELIKQMLHDIHYFVKYSHFIPSKKFEACRLFLVEDNFREKNGIACHALIIKALLTMRSFMKKHRTKPEKTTTTSAKKQLLMALYQKAFHHSQIIRGLSISSEQHKDLASFNITSRRDGESGITTWSKLYQYLVKIATFDRCCPTSNNENPIDKYIPLSCVA
jgi:hypothetical protein